MTYQQIANTGNQTAHVVLVAKHRHIAISTSSDDIKEVGQCAQKISYRFVVIRLAIVCGKPASYAGAKKGTICPTIVMNRVDQDYVSGIQGKGDGCGLFVVGGIVAVKGAPVFAEGCLLVLLLLR